MLDVTKDTFEAEVLKAEGKVLVDFYGDGCVPCAALMPHIHEFAEKYGDKMKFVSLNTTKARRLAIGQKVINFLSHACFVVFFCPLSPFTRTASRSLPALRTTLLPRMSRI